MQHLNLIVTMSEQNNTGWTHFEHLADIGIRGFGPTKAQAFEQAAMALTAVITEPEAVKDEVKVEIKCDAPDDELLLVEWLSKIIYEMSVRNMLFSRFSVQIDGNYLNAQAWGEKLDLKKHDPVVEVKAATYSALNVEKDDNGIWKAQCVLDV